MLVSGSSSFNLGNKLYEPLTGRKWEYELYPLSWQEFEAKVGYIKIGNEVNYNELSKLIGISKNTVQNYIEILEKGFVIFRLPSFARNLRQEIKKSRKIYFWDTGVRNTILANFNQLDLRQDRGNLWENFLIAERMKHLRYYKSSAKSYFGELSSNKRLTTLK